MSQDKEECNLVRRIEVEVDTSPTPGSNADREVFLGCGSREYRLKYRAGPLEFQDGSRDRFFIDANPANSNIANPDLNNPVRPV